MLRDKIFDFAKSAAIATLRGPRLAAVEQSPRRRARGLNIDGGC